MKRLICIANSSVFILSVLFVAFTCEDKNYNEVLLTNLSSDTICVFSSHDEAMIERSLNDSQLLSLWQNISPKETRSIHFVSEHDNILHVVVLKRHTFETTLINENIDSITFDKRYILTLEQLENINYNIKYH